MQLLADITREFNLASLVVTHDTDFTSLAQQTITMKDGKAL